MRRAMQLDPKGLEAAKEWRGHGTTEQIIRAYLEAAPSPSSAPGVVELPVDEAAAICKRLEYDASWDKCGHGYYRLKRALAALSQPAKGEGEGGE